ncbi:hypothetical protein POM88_018666 [Heracleum sosnowskyi]|uniref:F-box domain-containing protein n=1 Tax=Heracleum sosnowskyi TaxID=360622 RepID=A0AAD8ISS1_9APIA|nr:hypothetical protein POM88_018666 [Heracleum sosnowskyi]
MVIKGSEQGGNQMPERAQQLTTLPTLPHDVILEILYRSPVKDLIRFRCVSKTWLALTLDPTFIHMHLDHNKPSIRIMFHGSTPDYTDAVMASTDPTMTEVLFKVKYNEPYRLGYPTGFKFRDYTNKMVFCGSVNGIVCLSYYRSLGNDDSLKWERIVLWNPAINCCKSILVPARKFIHDNSTRVSVGLGYDADATDFRIVRIVPDVSKSSSTDDIMSRVEIFSNKKDCWEDVNDGAFIPFCPVLQNCNFIIKGVPYWQAEGGLAVIDPCTGMYRRVPYPKYVTNQRTWVNPVNSMDSVAVFVYSPGIEVNDLVDVYVLDDSCGSWMKKYTTGPIEFEQFRLPQCLATGELVVHKYERMTSVAGDSWPIIDLRTFFYNPVTGHLSTAFDTFKANWSESYHHVDSLVFLKGMEPLDKEVKKKNWDKFLSKGFKFLQCFLLKSDTG